MSFTANTIVIYPKGTITNRILVMVSAIVFAKENNFDIKMIWDHPVHYNTLFLGNIDIVTIPFFHNKNYVYNPNMNQQEIINQLIYTFEEMYAIIETDQEIIPQNHSNYLIKRTIEYKKLLKENMSGNLLGQISLIDFPTEPFCSIHGSFDTKLKQLHINNDLFDINNTEVLEYVRTLVLSKANILICSDSIPNEYINASIISLNTIICLKDIDYTSKIINYCKGYMGYALTINPDIQKISLL